MKLQNLVALKQLLGTSGNDIQAAISCYLAPRERLVVAGKAYFLPITQNQKEKDNDFIAQPREAARYYGFSKFRTVLQAEERWVKFISGPRDPESKNKLLDSLRQDSASSREDHLTTLHYRSQAIRFDTCQL